MGKNKSKLKARSALSKRPLPRKYHQHSTNSQKLPQPRFDNKTMEISETTVDTAQELNSAQKADSKVNFSIDVIESDVINISDSSNSSKSSAPIISEHESIIQERTTISLDQSCSEIVKLNEKTSSGTNETNIPKIINNTFKIIDVNKNQKIVILYGECKLCFHGLMTIQLIYGQVEILGYTIKDTTQKFKVYSLRGTSLLTIQNLNNTQQENKNILVNSATSDLSRSVHCTNNSSVIWCTPLGSKKILFIEKHIAQRILPDTNPNQLACNFIPHDFGNKISIAQDWLPVVSSINEFTKLLICGGKDVGKSTFMRYTINKLLLNHAKVRVMDLDPGQCEFTCPGCISVIVIDKPLLGSSYSHIISTERSYICGIDVAHDPKKFLAIVEHLVAKCDLFEDEIPTIINTMGFSHGIGLNITASVISLVQPTHLVEIQSRNPKKNFKVELRCQEVKRGCRLLQPQKRITVNYVYTKLQSVTDTQSQWTLKARQFREMCILSYCSKMVDIQRLSILAVNSCIYEFTLSSLQIFDINGKTLSPSVVNANFVALCSIETGHNLVFRCYGWGIIRGIDILADRIVIMTPESTNVLDKVTCLVNNNIMLPASVYMTPESVTGNIPYVVSGTLISFGQITQRTRIAPMPYKRKAY